MKIGVDVDGVIADYITAYRQLVIETSGRDVFKGEWASWDYELDCGYTRDERKVALAARNSDASFWNNLPNYAWTDAAMKSLGELWQDDHDIYFITDRKGVNPKNQTEMWLDAFNTVPPTVLISAEKGLCCKALDLDLYIDDKNENCLDVKARSPKTLCVMLTQPWNQNQDGIPRIGHINEFFATIQEATDASRSE